MGYIKTISAALAVAMGLAVLTGCTGGGSPVTSVTSEDTSEVTSTNATQDTSASDTSLHDTSGAIQVSSDLAVELEVQDLTSDKEEVFRQGYLDFSFDLLKRCIESSEKDKNTMISPASVMLALDLTAAGARGNTLAEMTALFGGAKDPQGQISYAAYLMKRLNDSEFVKLHAANSIWVNKTVMPEGITPEYAKFVHDMFDAGSESLTFDPEALSKINGWVNEHTSGMIPKVLDSLDPSMAMLLINAISFEGKWETQYTEGSVIEEPFTDSSGTKVPVQMLNGTSSVYLENDIATGFIKPYEGGRYGFVVMLPKDESSDAGKMLSSFDGRTFDEYLRSGQEDLVVRTKMPEFSYDWDASLVPELQAMGMNTPFTPGADFSGILDPGEGGGLYIGDVIHKTHIEVDRNGTKAAAVTAVSLYKNASIVNPKDAKTVFCDRPFAYAIVDLEDMTPLFIGTVNTIDK